MKTWNKNKKYTNLLITAVFLLTSSCAVRDPIANNNHDAIENALKDGLRTNKSLRSSSGHAQSSLPVSVQRALMPGLNLPTLQANQNSPTDDGETRFDIAVSNVPAKDFFMGLVKDTKYNMSINPQITGNVSLELKSVSVPQAMDAVRDTYGFEYERTSYGFKVFPRHLDTRIFNVNYLDLDRSGQSQTTVGSGQITNTIQNTLTASGVSSSQQTGAIPNGLVQTSTSSKFWDLLKQNLETIIGTKDGRSLVVNPRSGSIIVKAYPDELRHVAQYLDGIQNIIHRQVIIEAKILDIELNAQFQSGINWHVLGFQQGFNAIKGSSNNISDNINDNDSSDATKNLPSFIGALSLTAKSGGAFDSAINLLNYQGNVNVLSSPRIATINNQKAVIKVGDDKFFVTNVSSNTNNNGLINNNGNNTTANITLTPFFSGISLDVTPQIDENDNVTLHVHPIISKVTRDVQTFLVNNQQQKLPLAASTVKESDSIVRAKNGQVIVIGGLMESSGENYQASTPGADSLPGISGLFKNKNKVSRKRELIILLRPIIAESTRTWQQQLQDAATAVKNMKGDFSYNIVPAKQTLKDTTKRR